MKSDDVTMWQIVKHIFGVHTWGEWKFYHDHENYPNQHPVHYRNCELCGQEQECSVNHSKEKPND